MSEKERLNLIWQGKPEFIPYIIKSVLELLGYFVFISIPYSLIGYFKSKGESINDPVYINGILIIIGGIGIYHFIKRLVEFKKIQYSLTYDSIVIESGIFSSKKKIINRDKIQFVERNSNMIEKYFKVNTIKFYSGKETRDNEDRVKKEFDKFESIKDTISIMTFFKK
ncbi:PH domain-containing protein [Carboxylicivirga marina]|uniref:PH domain-containing protein n=1 Tax=Carboxylicivirga marina TaxID=2800988 RepID=A0ABS1HPQ3_9BACT|nr:PH domain-containing protein [Carboxylicivirga marina]MBK3519616.1 PH domain-containing protein [Carboxylicivirga marina]